MEESPETSAASKEDDDGSRVDSSSSFGSFTSREFEDEQQHEYSAAHALSKSNRWIPRSLQRKLASSRSSFVSEEEVTTHKVMLDKTQRKSKLHSFLRKFTPSGKSSSKTQNERQEKINMRLAFLEDTTKHRKEEKKEQAVNSRLTFTKDITIYDGFDLDDLLRGSFEVLQDHSFAMSYKVKMESGQELLVIRMRDPTSILVFKQCVEQLFCLRHSCILSLQAFHYSADEAFLVYPCMMLQGSIHSALHSPCQKLPVWDTRFAWISQVAHGLAYLHRSSAIPHGCLNSSNILLNHRGEALIADHGIFSLVNINLNQYKCYAPLQEPHNFTKETDVYAFGVFVFELLTGADPFAKNMELERISDQIIRYVEWVRTRINVGRILQLLHSTAADSPQVINELLHLGHMCTEEMPSARPSMSEVEDLVGRLINRDNRTDSLPLNSAPPSNSSVPPLSPSSDTEPCNLPRMLEGLTKNLSPAHSVGIQLEPEAKAIHRTENSQGMDHLIPDMENKENKKKATFNSRNTLTVNKGEVPTSAIKVKDDLKASPMLEFSDKKEESCEGCIEIHDKFDIGIPPGYCSEGPLKAYHVSVMNGLAAALGDAINSYSQFDEVIKHITKFTMLLVGLGAPLDEWNSLAQRILHAVKHVEGPRRSEFEGEDVESITQLIPDLDTKAEERKHAIEEDRWELDRSKQRLVLAQKHQTDLKQKIDKLQKQVEVIQRQVEDLKETIYIKG